MFLSVIIPVYNVEKYLCQCIDSIINKLPPDSEIILVDDGSPDNSPKICDDYADKYDFIKVIHKQNGGLSMARNTGIEASNAEYIMFLDSDDFWNTDVDFDKIFSTVKNNKDTELFVLSSLDYREGLGTFERKDRKTLDNVSTESIESYYRDLLNHGNLEVHAATKIIKRDFLVKNNLYFTSGILSEDNDWMIRILRVLKSVKIINEPIYIYRMGREGSITNTIGVKNIVFLIQMIERSIEYYYAENAVGYKDYEFCYCAYLWFLALGLSCSLSKTDRMTLADGFEKTSLVCSYSNSKKTRICYKIKKVFGLNFLSFLLKLYLKLKKSPLGKGKKVD